MLITIIALHLHLAKFCVVIKAIAPQIVLFVFLFLFFKLKYGY